MPPHQASPPADRILDEVIHPRFSLFDDSTTRERQSALTGRIAEYAIIVLVVFVITGLEISRWLFRTPPQPLLFSFMALCLTGYATVRVALIWRQVRVLRREQRARQNLRAAIGDICARGWLLFDGLLDGKGHLLGSVLAGPGGVFTLIPRFIVRGDDLTESVARRDADTLAIGNQEILADPVGQARRASQALYELLAEGGQETIPVQPVLIFPGWNITPDSAGADADVWLLSDTDIVPRLTRLPVVMEARDLIAVSLLLERLVVRR